MRYVVIGTAGHIDHGKSALVRALTGIDPDRLKEEKARGITIDLGFAHAEIDGVTVALVDVPGHERFVKNMLAGATGIDAVLLVVAADESVMPQTREHFEICRLLGVRAGVVALTKVDLVDAETVELVRLEVKDLVRGSFLDTAPVVAVSTVTGQGLDDLRRALAAMSRTLPRQTAAGPSRLPVDRVFSVKGFGTVVTGTLVAGRIAVDDELVVLPAGRRVKVRGLQAHGRAVPDAEASQRLAVNLAGVDVDDLRRGDTLTVAGAFVPTRTVDARLETLAGGRPLRHGTRVRFHCGTTEILGRVLLSALVDAATPEGPPPGEVPPGHRAYVRIKLEAPAVVTRGDRFILRAYSPAATIAGGMVLDPSPPRGGIRTPGGQQRFRAIDVVHPEMAPVAFAERLLEERGPLGVTADLLVSRAGLDPPAARDVRDRMVANGKARLFGSIAVAVPVVERLVSGLLETVANHHRDDPLSAGVSREEVRSRLFARADDALFDAVVTALVAEGRLEGRDRLALPGFRPGLLGEEEPATRLVARAFEEAGLAPPDASRVSDSLGLDPGTTERAVTLLLRQKVLQRVEGLVFHSAALERLEREVRALKPTPAGARLDVATFKERFGVSRKFAIPLLEYLDRRRVTRRVGDVRVVL